MTINLSKHSTTTAGRLIRAITPTGTIDKGFFSPSGYDDIGFSQQLVLLADTHDQSQLSYNRGKDLNQGIGGFTLEERASDSRNSGWNFQIATTRRSRQR